MPHSSVTDVPCTCNSLERMAAEPTCPIEFDAETNEFEIVIHTADGGCSRWAIYHCPFCGGTGPKSLRHTLFAVLTASEDSRLRDLTRDINTVDEIIARFGPPTRDFPDGFVSGSAPSDREAPESTAYRVLHYSDLSEVADVDFVDLGPHGIRKTFRGKYLGKSTTKDPSDTP